MIEMFAVWKKQECTTLHIASNNKINNIYVLYYKKVPINMFYFAFIKVQ